MFAVTRYTWVEVGVVAPHSCGDLDKIGVTEMPNRLFELVALGPALRDEAKRHGKGINESYLLVHHVLAQAFREDLARIPREKLRAHLSSRLQQSLQACA